MVDSTPAAALPSDVFVLPMVMPSGALDINSLRVYVKNESAREMSIGEGTVIGGMYCVDSVATSPPKETAHQDFNESVINFGDSPISEEWKTRLQKKLAQKSHVFSTHDWAWVWPKGWNTKFVSLTHNHSARDPADWLLPTSKMFESIYKSCFRQGP